MDPRWTPGNMWRTTAAVFYISITLFPLLVTSPWSWGIKPRFLRYEPYTFFSPDCFADEFAWAQICRIWYFCWRFWIEDSGCRQESLGKEFSAHWDGTRSIVQFSGRWLWCVTMLCRLDSCVHIFDAAQICVILCSIKSQRPEDRTTGLVPSQWATKNPSRNPVQKPNPPAKIAHTRTK